MNRQKILNCVSPPSQEKVKKSRHLVSLGSHQTKTQAISRLDELVSNGIVLLPPKYSIVKTKKPNGKTYYSVQVFTKNEKQKSDKYTPISFIKTQQEHQEVYFNQLVTDKILSENAKREHKCTTRKELIKKIDNGDYKLLTFTDYTDKVHKHILPFFQKKYIRDITKKDIQQFYEHLVDTPSIQKISTYKLIFIHLKRLFDFALEENYIEDVPKFPEIRNVDQSFNQPASYSDEDLDLMKAEADEDQLFLINLLLETGLRPEELDKAGIEPKNEHDVTSGDLTYFDMENKNIIIESYRANKKKRVIKISDKLYSLIKQRIENGILHSRISPYPTKRKALYELQCLSKKIERKHNKRIVINLKKFRATVSNQKLKEGWDYLKVCKFLGHSPKVNFDNYTNDSIVLVD